MKLFCLLLPLSAYTFEFPNIKDLGTKKIDFNTDF